jgi:hypothetical protein
MLGMAIHELRTVQESDAGFTSDRSGKQCLASSGRADEEESPSERERRGGRTILDS